VVVLPGSKAIDRGTHWQGGPDFLVEILSPDDRAREKIPFYGRLGVRELLIVDRDPWGLELWRRQNDELALVERIGPDDSRRLKSNVLPLSFHLVAGQPRPRIVAASTFSPQEWTL
jgi:Uma2 family endonuclease